MSLVDAHLNSAHAEVRAWRHPAPTAPQPPSVSCGDYMSLQPHRLSSSCKLLLWDGPVLPLLPQLALKLQTRNSKLLIPQQAARSVSTPLCLRSYIKRQTQSNKPSVCLHPSTYAATSSWASSSPPRPPCSPRSTCWSFKSAWTQPSRCPLRSSGALDGWARPGTAAAAAAAARPAPPLRLHGTCRSGAARPPAWHITVVVQLRHLPPPPLAQPRVPQAYD